MALSWVREALVAKPLCARLAAARLRSIVSTSCAAISGGGANRARRASITSRSRDAADPSTHDGERGDGDAGGLPERRQEEPGDGARLLKRPSDAVHAFPRLLAAARELARRRGDGVEEELAAIERPVVAEHALPRALTELFCLLP